MQPPVFVRINKYKELATILKKIQERLDAADKTITELSRLKEEEETRITEWKENLEQIQNKLGGVSEALHQR